MLDIGCGSGNYIISIAKQFPNSTFIGLDYSDQAIKMAKDLQQSKGVTNVTFVEGDAHNLPQEYTGCFDLVYMCDALHDLPNPGKALDEVYRVMKDDGHYSLIEIGLHSDPKDNVGNLAAAMFYSVGMFTCLSASLTQPPHVGYGPMWGREEIEKILRSHRFKLDGKDAIVFIEEKACFHCTK